MQTFKFRLAPSKSQRTKLLQALELCRWVFNETLATRKKAWEQEKKSITRFDTIKLLPIWKAEKPELSLVYSQVLQEVCTRVDLAFQSYFRRVKEHAEKAGYPRFKGYGRYNSFTYPQTGFELLENGLMLSKIGAIKIIQHRPIEGRHRVKTLNIQRDAVGNWYACFACEVEPRALPFNQRSSPVDDLAVGIDMGLATFATLSNGVSVDNPRFFRRAEYELGRAQRRYSKDKTPKRRKVIANIHQRIANRRKDFAHKLSHELVSAYGVIFFENLSIKNMMKNHQLAKSIGDAAWRQLIQYTQYKAEWAGGVCELVDPRGTSQRCSGCQTVVQKDLSVRVHECPSCGLVLDRDLNASLNIEALGLESLGAPAFRRGE
ncbi:transposase [Candidatus Villigracilis saccharophilus]|uniref:RNA-guided endonuclease InsQ/TnpB family protein n=1 Tax=Candidatus Villigracilis saccharophilus TaxID=3140684 RepID=UPI0031346AE6|nr:transposase [Anaerolineales bacterium]